MPELLAGPTVFTCWLLNQFTTRIHNSYAKETSSTDSPMKNSVNVDVIHCWLNWFIINNGINSIIPDHWWKIQHRYILYFSDLVLITHVKYLTCVQRDVKTLFIAHIIFARCASIWFRFCTKSIVIFKESAYPTFR